MSALTFPSFPSYQPAATVVNTSPTMHDVVVRREDDDLVARSQEGDAAAFDQLVVKYSPRIYAVVYNMTSNHEDTNDLLQDTFAKAFRAVRSFRGKSSFSTWLHSIAINYSINFLRKRNRRHNVSLNDIDSGVERDKEFIELTSPTNPQRENELRELQVRLNESMLKLTEDHRAVVTLHDIQGMAHAEISQILGVSEGTVRSRLFYAHQKLQKYLEDLRKP